MTFSEILYGVMIPLTIFLVSFITTIILYRKFSKEIGKDKREKP